MAAAAAELGVSKRQVTRLARARDLDVTREVGGALLLDSASVHRWAQRRRLRGRPWSEGKNPYFASIATDDETTAVVATTDAAETVPIAAVAVDLMESLDTRERSAGARVLQELIDARR